MTNKEILYQARAAKSYTDKGGASFDFWVKSKGFTQKDAEEIRYQMYILYKGKPAEYVNPLNQQEVK